MRRGLPAELLEPGPGRHRLGRRFGGGAHVAGVGARRPRGDADGDGDADPLAPDEVSPVGPGSIFGLSCATERAASSTAGSTTQVTGAVARPLRLRSRSSRPSGDRDRCHERMPSSRPAAPRRTSFLTGTISASRVRGVPRGDQGEKAAGPAEGGPDTVGVSAQDVHPDPVDPGLAGDLQARAGHGHPVGRRLPGSQVADHVVQALGGDPGADRGVLRGPRGVLGGSARSVIGVPEVNR